MFHKIFFLRKSKSIEDASLNGKIAKGHCKGHNTMILLISIDGFKERTKKLYLQYEDARKNLS